MDDSSSYLVYELPKESPNDGPRTSVANPADQIASPFGWHDTNGQAGAEYTTTRGNNAYADADADFNGQPDAGVPDGGSGLDFAFPADLSQNPSTYSAAAITNAFYVSNRVHDVLYRLVKAEAGEFRVPVPVGR